MRKLETEEITYINELICEIANKTCFMNLERFIGKKKHYVENFVGSDCEDFPNRMKAERFTFFNRDTVSLALREMFTDPYVIKKIAKNCCILEADERFTEEYDVEIPLGKCMLEDKSLVVTSIVQAVIKVRDYDDRNDDTGLPFDIIKFRLIPDDISEEIVYAGSFLDGSYKDFDERSLAVC